MELPNALIILSPLLFLFPSLNEVSFSEFTVRDRCSFFLCDRFGTFASVCVWVRVCSNYNSHDHEDDNDDYDHDTTTTIQPQGFTTHRGNASLPLCFRVPLSVGRATVPSSRDMGVEACHGFFSALAHAARFASGPFCLARTHSRNTHTRACAHTHTAPRARF